MLTSFTVLKHLLVVAKRRELRYSAHLPFADRCWYLARTNGDRISRHDFVVIKNVQHVALHIYLDPDGASGVTGRRRRRCRPSFILHLVSGIATELAPWL